MKNQLKNNEKAIQQEEARLRASDADLLEEEATLRTFVDANINAKNVMSNQQPFESQSMPLKNDVEPSVSVTNHHGPPTFTFVPLNMGGNGRTHLVSEGSKRLLQEEVTLEDLQKMTTLFYNKAFADKTLDKFIRSHSDPHGERFAKWIHQKLTGSTVWDEERHSRTSTYKPVLLADGFRHVVHDRSSAHVAAWYSPKRPSEEVGRHFKLDECRVWMRLHFWALRESGLMDTSPSFADYYVRFIGHFVNVYESSAPVFARESLRWSAKPTNIQTYFDNGNEMKDVLGLSAKQAIAQLPKNEANDAVWPYNENDPRNK